MGKDERRSAMFGSSPKKQQRVVRFHNVASDDEEEKRKRSIASAKRRKDRKRRQRMMRVQLFNPSQDEIVDRFLVWLTTPCGVSFCAHNLRGYADLQRRGLDAESSATNMSEDLREGVDSFIIAARCFHGRTFIHVPTTSAHRAQLEQTARDRLAEAVAASHNSETPKTHKEARAAFYASVKKFSAVLKATIAATRAEVDEAVTPPGDHVPVADDDAAVEETDASTADDDVVVQHDAPTLVVAAAGATHKRENDKHTVSPKSMRPKND